MKEYNIEALKKQENDIHDKIKRLEAQLVLVETAIKRANTQKDKPQEN